jgi:hypothetical protein
LRASAWRLQVGFYETSLRVEAQKKDSSISSRPSGTIKLHHHHREDCTPTDYKSIAFSLDFLIDCLTRRKIKRICNISMGAMSHFKIPIQLLLTTLLFHCDLQVEASVGPDSASLVHSKIDSSSWSVSCRLARDMSSRRCRAAFIHTFALNQPTSTYLNLRGGWSDNSDREKKEEEHEDEDDDDLDWSDAPFTTDMRSSSSSSRGHHNVQYQEDIHATTEEDVWDDDQKDVVLDEKQENDDDDAEVTTSIESDVIYEDEGSYTESGAVDETAIETNVVEPQNTDVTTTHNDDTDTTSTMEDHLESSKYVDRMDFADAYDEDVAVDTDLEAKEQPDRSGIPVASVIDNETRQVLIKKLKYKAKEVDAMIPEIGFILVSKNLQRPFEGMPTNWCKPGYQPSSTRNIHPFVKALPKIVLPVIIGAIAVKAGTNKFFFSSSSSTSTPNYNDSFSEVKSNDLASASVSDFPAYDDLTADLSSAATHREPLVPQTEPLRPVNDHTNALRDKHPHSLKPGLPVEDELDVTWLDKLLTAVERKIKVFLQIKI